MATKDEKSWIRFVPLDKLPQARTDRWHVISAAHIGVLLGEIAWYSSWRKYCYFPNTSLALVLDKKCLRDIADFSEQKTLEHYQMLERMRDDKTA